MLDGLRPLCGPPVRTLTDSHGCLRTSEHPHRRWKLGLQGVDEVTKSTSVRAAAGPRASGRGMRDHGWIINANPARAVLHKLLKQRAKPARAMLHDLLKQRAKP